MFTTCDKCGALLEAGNLCERCREPDRAPAYADLLAGIRRALGCKFLDCDVRRELRSLVARVEGKD